MKIPVQLIVGPKDVEAGEVSVRTQEGEQKIKLEGLAEFLKGRCSKEHLTMSLERPRIAVDVDDVLSQSAKGFVAYSNQRWGTKPTVDDYDDHWAEMWKIEREGGGAARDRIS
jgi:hypothetical protein